MGVNEKNVRELLRISASQSQKGVVTELRTLLRSEAVLDEGRLPDRPGASVTTRGSSRT
jgi:hypothetical protein